MTVPVIDTRLDLGKARELIDGFAPAAAPYRDCGEPSWFRTEAERREYWLVEASAIVAWAREHGFAHPRAAIRYGCPTSAHEATWAWGS